MVLAQAIDIHRHWFPPCYKDAILNSPAQSPSECSDSSSDYEPPPQGPDTPRTSVLSVPWPAALISTNPQTSRRLARAFNKQTAQMCVEQPQQWGFFAAMPSFTDVVGTVAELKHSLDELNADGIVAYTTYGRNGLHLGHEDFTGIWEQLNSRSAVVFVNPCPPASERDLSPTKHGRFPDEIAKAAIQLLASGRLNEIPQVKLILAYGGGSLLAGLRQSGNGQLQEEARKFYFDITGLDDAIQLEELLALAPTDHILYGTDLPFSSSGSGAAPSVLHDSYSASSGGAAQALRDNARKLFPKFD